MTAVLTDALVQSVLNRFQAELHNACPEQLEHLAFRAEAKCRTAYGARMRALVDAERAERAARLVA